jgi:PhnB protein
MIMLSDEYPEMDVRSPQTLGGTPVMMHLVVADVDAVAAVSGDAIRCRDGSVARSRTRESSATRR